MEYGQCIVGTRVYRVEWTFPNTGVYLCDCLTACIGCLLSVRGLVDGNVTGGWELFGFVVPHKFI